MWIKSDDNGHCERIIGGEDKVFEKKEKTNIIEKKEKANIIENVNDAIDNIMNYNSDCSVQMTDFAKDLVSKYDNELELCKLIIELIKIYKNHVEYSLISTYIYIIGKYITGNNLIDVSNELLSEKQKRDLVVARIILNYISNGYNRADTGKCAVIETIPMSAIYYSHDIEEYNYYEVVKSMSFYEFRIICNTFNFEILSNRSSSIVANVNLRLNSIDISAPLKIRDNLDPDYITKQLKLLLEFGK